MNHKIELNKDNIIFYKKDRGIDGQEIESKQNISYDVFEKMDWRINVKDIVPNISSSGDIQKITLHISDYETFEKESKNREKIEQKQQDIEKSVIINRDTISWNKYNQILINTAEWLYKKGYLYESKLPIYVSKGKRYLLNSVPKHDYGKDFQAKHKISDNIWLNIHFSARDCKRHAETLMNKLAPSIDYEIRGFDLN
ncbi:hypothetical protein Metev_0460 [Methanohalobium evestigatum Z-7303]|uniref:Uncharacterized protein n=1 Tax=Methanohalobium evestigatum (strain ATCC BAA-1072 / DSM 3721 / NBRC 107634 / OCM 161 / Z-7303) TaxID=644295 RepID=D7E833_METEZ|nr:hypothetical protein [Methanohalobium evestigatum]ADI73375.1 hypothetical protein Metev_0460 [Methanohalobium evestigatum Z-7303]